MSADPAKFGKMSLWSSGIVEFVWSIIWDTNVVQINNNKQTPVEMARIFSVIKE